jgi:hypothetical protein
MHYICVLLKIGIRALAKEHFYPTPENREG